jgi:hypothetical protein
VAAASDPRFLTLHGLRLKGFAEAPAVAAAVGLEVAAVEEQLAKLAVEALATHREGRLSGWTLTKDGRAEQERLARDDLAGSGGLEGVRSAYAAFLELNTAFKVLCTDWQLRDGELYDHADAAYNQAIFDRLDATHARLGADVLEPLAALLGRFGTYGPRFDAALAGLLGGDLDLLTKPIIDSYHTIWFELHEDLITGLGIDRSQEGSF